VYNLAGGIKAWAGEKAYGPLDLGLLWFQGDEEYPDAVHLAYAMEDGLQKFYGNMAENASSPNEKKLFEQLAGYENIHMERLVKECQRAGLEEVSAAGSDPGVMEGGMTIEEMQARTPAFASVNEILEFAMALEAQAYDLYGRMAHKCTDDESRHLFVRMMDEERAHLNHLSFELDKVLS